MVTMARPPKTNPKPIEPVVTPPGQRLAQVRKLRGYSQQALADELGLSQKQITDYETGRVHMNDEMIVRFSLALKVSADTLLGLKDIDTPETPTNTRFTRRLRELEQLPESKKKAVIRILDEFISPA
jgi:transcriptional regulator with XRE-family HTH domain